MTTPKANQPLFIMLYGLPGAGKTYFARQLCQHMQAAHVQDDRMRHELFAEPKYGKQENATIAQLMNYMGGELLRAGANVVYDTNVLRLAQRRTLRDMARKFHAQPLLIWLQIDVESAFTRVAGRDRRRSDDKYAMPMDRSTFDGIVGHMQNPTAAEDYMVISGKHAYATQQSSVVKRLQELGLMSAEEAAAKVVRPEMVNLVSNLAGGRVDQSRRNIVIR